MIKRTEEYLRAMLDLRPDAEIPAGLLHRVNQAESNCILVGRMFVSSQALTTIIQAWQDRVLIEDALRDIASKLKRDVRDIDANVKSIKARLTILENDKRGRSQRKSSLDGIVVPRFKRIEDAYTQLSESSHKNIQRLKKDVEMLTAQVNTLRKTSADRQLTDAMKEIEE